jgi:two-component system KDP operon response regulator KdpE
MEELLARVRVALRRGASDRMQQPLITTGDLTVDVERRRVTLEGAGLHLTPTEYELLKYLALHAGKVLTHTMILRAVWGPDYVHDTHVLRTCISQLRTKLKDRRPEPRFIATEPGVGYRFLLPDQDS